MRGPEIMVPKPDNGLRVWCVGGSTTFDIYAPDNASTWPAVTQDVLLLGTNPVFSQGGSAERGDSGSVLTAPAGAPSGKLARYPVMIAIYRHGGIYNQTVNMQSGTRLPAGEAMQLSVEPGAPEGCTDARVD
jgi:hypothetical protein